jgi:hypothetical protein
MGHSHSQGQTFHKRQQDIHELKIQYPNLVKILG